MAAQHCIVRTIDLRRLFRPDGAGPRPDDGSLEYPAGGITRARRLCDIYVPIGDQSLFALAEAASAFQTPLGYAKAIAAWLDRRRGLALGIAMSGVGLGGFVMPQLAQALIDSVGWRGACPSLGLLR